MTGIQIQSHILKVREQLGREVELRRNIVANDNRGHSFNGRGTKNKCTGSNEYPRKNSEGIKGDKIRDFITRIKEKRIVTTRGYAVAKY